MRDRTYADLFRDVQSLAGIDAFAAAESANILSFVNHRYHEAWKASDLWPRYLVTSQARPSTTRGIVPWVYDAIAGRREIMEANREADTVTIVCAEPVTFVPGMFVEIAGVTGTDPIWGEIPVTGLSRTTRPNDTFTIALAEITTPREEYQVTLDAAVSPVPVGEIDTFHSIWDREPFRPLGTRPAIKFAVESEGARVLDPCPGRLPVGFWVSYKRRWPGPVDETSTAIPEEFFHFIARASFSDFLRMDQQTDRALAEERIARTMHLTPELMNAQIQANSNNVFSRTTTHATQQYRSYY